MAVGLDSVTVVSEWMKWSVFQGLSCTRDEGGGGVERNEMARELRRRRGGCSSAVGRTLRRVGDKLPSLYRCLCF